MDLPIPVGTDYFFHIEQGDITYVADCWAKATVKKSYAADWIVHDPVQYRVKKHKVYLERPNGKELQLGLVMKIRNFPDASADPTPETNAKPARLAIPECH